ncbi:uncharacterized protein LOC135928644 [Gordionus sp. m RMFG-2023]|uniref:uncharacterized protein LOC135928644 n=1 Tax=Gordionus sp. m RMFG-2023 TaxID=3053472 RepID=UPI0031FC3E42
MHEDSNSSLGLLHSETLSEFSDCPSDKSISALNKSDLKFINEIDEASYSKNEKSLDIMKNINNHSIIDNNNLSFNNKIFNDYTNINNYNSHPNLDVNSNNQISIFQKLKDSSLIDEDNESVNEIKLNDSDLDELNDSLVHDSLESNLSDDETITSNKQNVNPFTFNQSQNESNSLLDRFFYSDLNKEHRIDKECFTNDDQNEIFCHAQSILDNDSMEFRLQNLGNLSNLSISKGNDFENYRFAENDRRILYQEENSPPNDQSQSRSFTKTAAMQNDKANLLNIGYNNISSFLRLGSEPLGYLNNTDGLNGLTDERKCQIRPKFGSLSINSPQNDHTPLPLYVSDLDSTSKHCMKQNFNKSPHSKLNIVNAILVDQQVINKSDFQNADIMDRNINHGPYGDSNYKFKKTHNDNSDIDLNNQSNHAIPNKAGVKFQVSPPSTPSRVSRARVLRSTNHTPSSNILTNSSNGKFVADHGQRQNLSNILDFTMPNCNQDFASKASKISTPLERYNGNIIVKKTRNDKFDNDKFSKLAPFNENQRDPSYGILEASAERSTYRRRVRNFSDNVNNSINETLSANQSTIHENRLGPNQDASMNGDVLDLRYLMPTTKIHHLDTTHENGCDDDDMNVLMPYKGANPHIVEKNPHLMQSQYPANRGDALNSPQTYQFRMKVPEQINFFQSCELGAQVSTSFPITNQDSQIGVEISKIDFDGHPIFSLDNSMQLPLVVPPGITRFLKINFNPTIPANFKSSLTFIISAILNCNKVMEENIEKTINIPIFAKCQTPNINVSNLSHDHLLNFGYTDQPSFDQKKQHFEISNSNYYILPLTISIENDKGDSKPFSYAFVEDGLNNLNQLIHQCYHILNVTLNPGESRIITVGIIQNSNKTFELKDCVRLSNICKINFAQMDITLKEILITGLLGPLIVNMFEPSIKQFKPLDESSIELRMVPQSHFSILRFFSCDTKSLAASNYSRKSSTEKLDQTTPTKYVARIAYWNNLLELKLLSPNNVSSECLKLIYDEVSKHESHPDIYNGSFIKDARSCYYLIQIYPGQFIDIGVRLKSLDSLKILKSHFSDQDLKTTLLIKNSLNTLTLYSVPISIILNMGERHSSPPQKSNLINQNPISQYSSKSTPSQKLNSKNKIDMDNVDNKINPDDLQLDEYIAEKALKGIMKGIESERYNNENSADDLDELLDLKDDVGSSIDCASGYLFHEKKRDGRKDSYKDVKAIIPNRTTQHNAAKFSSNKFLSFPLKSDHKILIWDSATTKLINDKNSSVQSFKIFYKNPINDFENHFDKNTSLKAYIAIKYNHCYAENDKWIKNINGDFAVSKSKITDFWDYLLIAHHVAIDHIMK